MVKPKRRVKRDKLRNNDKDSESSAAERDADQEPSSRAADFVPAFNETLANRVKRRFTLLGTSHGLFTGMENSMYGQPVAESTRLSIADHSRLSLSRARRSSIAQHSSIRSSHVLFHSPNSSVSEGDPPKKVQDNLPKKRTRQKSGKQAKKMSEESEKSESEEDTVIHAGRVTRSKAHTQQQGTEESSSKHIPSVTTELSKRRRQPSRKAQENFAESKEQHADRNEHQKDAVDMLSRHNAETVASDVLKNQTTFVKNATTKDQTFSVRETTPEDQDMSVRNTRSKTLNSPVKNVTQQDVEASVTPQRQQMGTRSLANKSIAAMWEDLQNQERQVDKSMQRSFRLSVSNRSRSVVQVNHSVDSDVDVQHGNKDFTSNHDIDNDVTVSSQQSGAINLSEVERIHHGMHQIPRIVLERVKIPDESAELSVSYLDETLCHKDDSSADVINPVSPSRPEIQMETKRKSLRTEVAKSDVELKTDCNKNIRSRRLLANDTYVESNIAATDVSVKRKRCQSGMDISESEDDIKSEVPRKKRLSMEPFKTELLNHTTTVTKKLSLNKNSFHERAVEYERVKNSTTSDDHLLTEMGHSRSSIGVSKQAAHGVSEENLNKQSFMNSESYTEERPNVQGDASRQGCANTPNKNFNKQTTIRSHITDHPNAKGDASSFSQSRMSSPGKKVSNKLAKASNLNQDLQMSETWNEEKIDNDDGHSDDELAKPLVSITNDELASMSDSNSPETERQHPSEISLSEVIENNSTPEMFSGKTDEQNISNLNELKENSSFQSETNASVKTRVHHKWNTLVDDRNVKGQTYVNDECLSKEITSEMECYIDYYERQAKTKAHKHDKVSMVRPKDKQYQYNLHSEHLSDMGIADIVKEAKHYLENVNLDILDTEVRRTNILLSRVEKKLAEKGVLQFDQSVNEPAPISHHTIVNAMRKAGHQIYG